MKTVHFMVVGVVYLGMDLFNISLFATAPCAYIFFDLNFFFLIANKSLYVVAEIQYLVVQPIRSLYDFLIF